MNTLNLDQVEQGIYQCIDTARELFKSAQILGKKKLFEIACSLYLLSIEQKGKAVLIYRTILIDEDDQQEWKDFWEDYKRHSKKLLAGIWLWADNFFNLYWDSQWGESIQDTQRKNILEWNESKQQGFYTCYDEKTGKFERIRSSLDEYIITRWASKQALEEMLHLKEIGFFKTDNLNKLKDAFLCQEGQILLNRYKREKKLKTPTSLKAEYDTFLNKKSLNDLDDLQNEATKQALKHTEINMFPTELFCFMVKRKLMRSLNKNYDKGGLF